MGNPAVPQQSGVQNIDSLINTKGIDLTAPGVSQIPGGTFDEFTSDDNSGVGFVLCKFEFSSGVSTSVNLICTLPDP